MTPCRGVSRPPLPGGRALARRRAHMRFLRAIQTAGEELDDRTPHRSGPVAVGPCAVVVEMHIARP